MVTLRKFKYVSKTFGKGDTRHMYSYQKRHFIERLNWKLQSTYGYKLFMVSFDRCRYFGLHVGTRNPMIAKSDVERFTNSKSSKHSKNFIVSHPIKCY